METEHAKESGQCPNSSGERRARAGSVHTRTVAEQTTRNGSTRSSVDSQKTDCSEGERRNHEQTCRETGVIRQRQRVGEKRDVAPGADTPDKITHAFTLKGYHWAYAMLEGERAGRDTMGRSKVIENRHFKITPGWYGVVVGKGMGLSLIHI